MANRFAEEHGVKVINATWGRKLEVFARVDFDELMKTGDIFENNCFCPGQAE